MYRTIFFVLAAGCFSGVALAQPENVLFLTSTGNDNGTDIVQERGNGGSNVLTVAIDGDLNGGGGAFSTGLDIGLTPGVLSQTGSGNIATLNVVGSNNLFALDQSGIGNMALLVVTGSGNQAAIAQAGAANVATLGQTGGRNIAIIRQRGY